MGLVFFIIHTYFVLTILNFVLYLISHRCRHVSKLTTKINEKLYWNGYMLLVFETFFDLIMVVLVNMKVADWSEEQWSVKYTNYFSVTAFCIIIGGSVIIMTFYHCKITSFQDEDWVAKYGSWLEGLQLDPEKEKY